MGGLEVTSTNVSEKIVEKADAREEDGEWGKEGVTTMGV